MCEILNNKLISILEQANITIGSSNISILNKKSYKFLLLIKKNLEKLGIIINDFNELNTVWKLNIILSRFVFKYSNFAENYLLALIENAIVINKSSFLEVIDQVIKRFDSMSNNSESNKAKEKRKKKIKTLKKCIKNISNIKELEFVEKCTIYNYIYQENQSNILVVDPDIFSKIRTLRNKAVHSEWIIEYFQNGTPFQNLHALYNLVDSNYQENFKLELNRIINKYELSFNFEQITLN